MKNIERGSIKHLLYLVIAIAISGMILYPLFDLILCKFITNSTFTYSYHNYIIQPTSHACIIGTILWYIDKNRLEK